MDPINPIAGNPEALNQTAPLLPRSDKTVIRAFFGLILILLVACIYLVYQNMQLQKQILALQVTSPLIRTATPAPAAQTDWKTYVNETYNFSFQYPPSFGTQGLISGPFTGTSIAVRTFSDPSTIREGTDAHFDGFSLYVVTNTKTSDFDTYISNEINAMNTAEFASMKNAVKIPLSNGVALVAQNGQAYYYLPAPDRRTVIVFAYLQADPAFKLTFDQIFSTFTFTVQKARTAPEATPANITKLVYSLPAGWKTTPDPTGVFEAGYDPATTRLLEAGVEGIQFMKQMLNPSGIGYAASMGIILYPYSGGSRHQFIYDHMNNGKPPVKEDIGADYKEQEYSYNGRSCLFLNGIHVSQISPIWGMCDAGNGKAFIISAEDPDYIKSVQTIRLLK